MVAVLQDKRRLVSFGFIRSNYVEWMPSTDWFLKPEGILTRDPRMGLNVRNFGPKESP